MDIAPLVHRRFRPTMCLKELVDLNKKLPSEVKNRIETTPFGWLLKLSDTSSYHISNTLLGELMERWDTGSLSFKVDNKLIKFVVEEMTLILGLSTKGATVDIHGNYSSRVSSSPCTVQKLCGGRHINVATILRAIECNRDNIDNYCRLYIAMAFGKFFFSQTGANFLAQPHIYLNDLDHLYSYNWGKAVYDYLVEGINSAVTKHSSGIHIKGCTIALQIWVLEHFPMFMRESANDFPRLLHWRVVYLKEENVKCILSAEVMDTLVPFSTEKKCNVVKEAYNLEDVSHSGGGTRSPLAVSSLAASPPSGFRTPSQAGSKTPAYNESGYSAGRSSNKKTIDKFCVVYLKSTQVEELEESEEEEETEMQQPEMAEEVQQQVVAEEQQPVVAEEVQQTPQPYRREAEASDFSQLHESIAALQAQQDRHYTEFVQFRDEFVQFRDEQRLHQQNMEKLFQEAIALFRTQLH